MLFATFVFLLPFICSANYLQEPPVKLLTIDYAALRFNATQSSYRESLQNGEDEEITLTDSEELHGLPGQKLTLHPGGCAKFNFPLPNAMNFSFIRPSKKLNEEGHWDFCNKALVTAKYYFNDESEPASKYCFGSDSKCSVEPCKITLPATSKREVHVELCADPPLNATDAAIWEIGFSQFADFSKLESTFSQDAQRKFDKMHEDPQFDTQLSVLSIVGRRGTGKSTIASFLSGNSTMFETSNQSTGTTTVGADMSPTIPAQEWIRDLSSKINQTMQPPSQNYPVLIIDSEGMGVREEIFDFMTASPPAIVSKVIIWVADGKVETYSLLKDIGNYMNSLDNIVLSPSDPQEFCKDPIYGHFVIVINMLRDDTSDVQLYDEIYTNSGDEELDEIRTKLKNCFTCRDARGLPFIELEEDEEFGFDVLNERYQKGLAEIADILKSYLPKPRTFSIGDDTVSFEAVNANEILEMVIEQANYNGTIDFTGFYKFWNSKVEELKERIHSFTNDMEFMKSSCLEYTDGSISCSPCICTYRNTFIDTSLQQMEQAYHEASLISQEKFGVDLTKQIEHFKEEFEVPWKKNHTCSSTHINPVLDGKMCDLASVPLYWPESDKALKCEMVFICNILTINANSFQLEADELYIAPSTELHSIQPTKAPNGQDGSNLGENGFNGQPGTKGMKMVLSSKYLMEGSAGKLSVSLPGGEGGDGGNGMVGSQAEVPRPYEPSNAQEVCTNHDSILVNEWSENDNYHCTLEHCHATDRYYVYRYRHSEIGCGGRGGDGGNGGNGGDSGDVQIAGGILLDVLNITPKSKGGLGGKGARDGQQYLYDMEFEGTRFEDEEGGCEHWDIDCECCDTYLKYIGFKAVNHGVSQEACSNECPCNSRDGVDGASGK